MRLTLPLTLLSACALGFGACGDDEDDGGGAEAQVFEVQATEDGEQSKVTAPESADPGAVEIRFRNTGERPHSLQVVQIGDGHTAKEALEAGEAWGEQGEALPEWVTLVGGIGVTEGGGSGIAVVDLDAGEYAAFDIEGTGPDSSAEFTVEGDEGPALPEVQATVEAKDYSFRATALEAGSHRVLLENNGEEPHHLAAAPLKPGKTVDDVANFVKTEKGQSPIVESKAFNTAILSGGEKEVVDLRFESGDYALLCFVPDRAGGPPHALKGMVAASSVE
jgi:hypothetical protein